MIRKDEHLKKASQKLQFCVTENVLEASLLGSVLHSREHLLAIQLRANLHSVHVQRRLSLASLTRSSTPRSTPTSTLLLTPTTDPREDETEPEHHVVDEKNELVPEHKGLDRMAYRLVLCLMVLLAVFFLTVVCSAWWRVDWKRLTKGRWNRRVYRKVNCSSQFCSRVATLVFGTRCT